MGPGRERSRGCQSEALDSVGLAGIVRLFRPRADSEVQVLFESILTAYRYAGGGLHVPVAA
jgi:hypothetical protein